MFLLCLYNVLLTELHPLPKHNAPSKLSQYPHPVTEQFHSFLIHLPRDPVDAVEKLWLKVNLYPFPPMSDTSLYISLLSSPLLLLGCSVAPC